MPPYSYSLSYPQKRAATHPGQLIPHVPNDYSLDTGAKYELIFDRGDGETLIQKTFRQLKGCLRPKPSATLNWTDEPGVNIYAKFYAQAPVQANVVPVATTDSDDDRTGMEPEAFSQEELEAKEEEDDTEEALLMGEGEAAVKADEGDRFVQYARRLLRNMDGEELVEFVSTYGRAIKVTMRERSRMMGRPLYKLDEDDNLVKETNWTCVKLPGGYLDSITINAGGTTTGPTRLQAFWIVIFATITENPHLWEALAVFLEKGTLEHDRHLTHDPNTLPTDPLGAIVYALSPNLQQPWEYDGMTYRPATRFQGHCNKPINSRVRALIERTGLSVNRWTMHVVAVMPGQNPPVSATHFVEHLMFALKNSTSQAAYGLNFNALDFLSWPLLIEGHELDQLLSTIDKVLRQYPDQRLPRPRDKEAWSYVFRDVSPVPELPLTIGFMMKGLDRRWTYEMQRRRYIDNYYLREQRTHRTRKDDIEITDEDVWVTGVPASQPFLDRTMLWIPPPCSAFDPFAAMESLHERVNAVWTALYGGLE